MTAVSIPSDFQAKEKESVTISTVSSSICHEVIGSDAMIFIFWMLSFKPALPLSSFTFIKRVFISSSLSSIRVVSSAYLKLLTFLQLVLHPGTAFHMMYSAFKLNKQGDNPQPWCIPFPIWNQTVVLYLVLTVASWCAYRFLRRQGSWSAIPISWTISRSLLWSTQRL